MIKGFENDQTVEITRHAINRIMNMIKEDDNPVSILSKLIFLVVDSVRKMASGQNEFDLINEGIETRYINDPFFNIYISIMFTEKYIAMRFEEFPEITFTDVYRRLAESNQETGDKTSVSEVKKAALKYLELFAD